MRRKQRGMPVMRVGVIVSTYNRPDYLEKVLLGYTLQTHAPTELIVADDGSGSETAELIARVRRACGFRLVHVWHPDRGFRKSEILNRAIAAATCEYLLFTDGDCIPRRDLVATHARLATPGRYVAGGYLRLPEDVSARITNEDVLTGRVAQLGWLRAQGWRPGRRALRLLGGPALGWLFDTLTPTRAEFQGNNASTWRAALLAVNGFDTEMGYGGLDKALGRRLQNHGVRGIQARHRAVCIHLHHDRPYRRQATLEGNRAILRRIRQQRETQARTGLRELGVQLP
jgi:glycosyltransferase involved in cell wall biosynthesis